MMQFNDIEPMQRLICGGIPCRKLAGEYIVVQEHCCCNDIRKRVNAIEDDGVLIYINPKVEYEICR